MFILLKHVYRKFLHNRGMALTGIGGLSLSMIAGILIFHYLFFELSFDKFHADVDRIYRINRNVMQVKGEIPSKSGGSTSRMAAEIINTSIPGVENTVRLHPLYGDAVVKTGMDSFSETNLYYSDPGFFSLFNFSCLYGDPRNALLNPNTAAISKTTSEKIFHKINSIGQSLEVYDRYLGKKSYTVAVVFDDLPLNTHLKINMLFPIADLLKLERYTTNPWKWANFRTYVKLNLGVDPQRVETQLDYYAEKHKIAAMFDCYKIDYQLHPIKSIHLSGFKDKFESDIKPLNIYLVLFAGILVMLIAWMNNFNLSWVRIMGDKRIMKVKRILGAKRLVFFKEFVYESITVYILAFLPALIISLSLSGFFKGRFGLNMEFTMPSQLMVWGSIISCFLILSVVSGLLIGIKGIGMVRSGQKGQGFGDGRSPHLVASSLTALQFAGAIILICFSVLAMKQINEMMGKDVGFEKEHILILKSPRLQDDFTAVRRLGAAFRHEALKIPEIKAVTSSMYIPGMFISSIQGIRLENESGTHEVDTRMNWIGTDYLPLYENRFMAGRNFSFNDSTESSKLIINEKLSQELGFSSPDAAIGQEVFCKQQDRMKQIIGVIRNFFHESPEMEYYPIAFHYSDEAVGYYSLKVRSNIRPDMVISEIQQLFEQIYPGDPFDYFWLNQSYNAQYAQWIKMKGLFMAFSLLAIFISVMGLVANIGLLLTKRTKEIGIRKVNGARVSDVLVMLNREFLKWVAIAIVIATPVAYYVMSKWLQNFAFKTGLSWWIFALAGVLTLGIALLTVSLQSWKTATRNPIEALRYE
jgi:putative ABC transport system permease protein